MTTELIPWNNIDTQIDLAKDFDTIKGMRDTLKGYETLAKQKKMSKDIQGKIVKYILKADRKMGEMLLKLPMNKGMNGKKFSGNKSVPVKDTTPTLKDMGLSKNESSLFKKMAKIPETKFNEMVENLEKDTETAFKNTITKIERENKIMEQKEAISKGEIDGLTGLYNVIVIDPPWRYHDEKVFDPSGFRGTCNYPTMTIDEIKKIILPAQENCVLWLWTTHKFMRHSFEILDAWGFEEKAILTWVKNKMGIGRWLRSKSEYCIMAVKGKPLINLTNETTVLVANNDGHSKKPQEFYDMVDKLCIGRKLDYFARKERKGWDVFGDEI